MRKTATSHSQGLYSLRKMKTKAYIKQKVTCTLETFINLIKRLSIKHKK